MKHVYLILRAAALVIVVTVFLPACKEQSNEPELSTEELNPDKPNANHLILAEAIGGDPAKSSTIYQIVESGDGGFYFHGSIDGYDVIGKFNQGGTVAWTRRQSVIRTILRIPNGSGMLANAIVAVGYDVISENQREAKVALLGSDGTPIAETVFRDSLKSVWFNGIALVASTSSVYEFVAGGAFNLRTGWPFFPYAARFTISSSGTMTKGGEQFFTSMTGRLFSGLVSDTLAGTRYLFAAGNYRTSDTTIQYPFVTRLDDSLNVVWNTDVIPGGNLKSMQYVGPVGFSNGVLIIEGGVETDQKPLAANGGYWSNGFVAAIGLGGEVLWTKTIAVSQHSEVFYQNVINNGKLYAVGRSCSFVKASKHWFGYGWLVKIDLATGTIEWKMQVGSDRYESGFSTVIVREGMAYCAGWTKRSDLAGGYQYWFAALDVSNPPSVSVPW